MIFRRKEADIPDEPDMLPGMGKYSTPKEPHQMSPQEFMEHPQTVFHTSRRSPEEWLTDTNRGVHVGSYLASADRQGYGNEAAHLYAGRVKAPVSPRVLSDNEVNMGPTDDEDALDHTGQELGSTPDGLSYGKWVPHRYAIPYINDVEDPGSMSMVLPKATDLKTHADFVAEAIKNGKADEVHPTTMALYKTGNLSGFKQSRDSLSHLIGRAAPSTSLDILDLPEGEFGDGTAEIRRQWASPGHIESTRPDHDARVEAQKMSRQHEGYGVSLGTDASESAVSGASGVYERKVRNRPMGWAGDVPAAKFVDTLSPTEKGYAEEGSIQPGAVGHLGVVSHHLGNIATEAGMKHDHPALTAAFRALNRAELEAHGTNHGEYNNQVNKAINNMGIISSVFPSESEHRQKINHLRDSLFDLQQGAHNTPHLDYTLRNWGK